MLKNFKIILDKQITICYNIINERVKPFMIEIFYKTRTGNVMGERGWETLPYNWLIGYFTGAVLV